MGMYDEIYVKQDLPLPEEIATLKDWKTYRFQTKDLDNCLSEYIINEYRELVEIVTEREYIAYTEEERKKLKIKPWNLWKEVKEGAITYNNMNYHGVVNFYTYDSIDDDTDFWVDFKAIFSHGKLENIEFLEFKKEVGRKEKNQAFFKKYEECQKNPWNVFKKYASYLGWKWFWRNISNFLYKISGIIEKVRMFILANML
jgi:hypothetical protein